MKKSDRNRFTKWAESLSDNELIEAYHDAIFDSLGSVTEDMYELGYDLRDIEEREQYEKSLAQKSDILEGICRDRGIDPWKTEEDISS